MIVLAASSGSVRPNIIPNVDGLGTGLVLAGVAGSMRPTASTMGTAFCSTETAPMHAPAISQAASRFDGDVDMWPSADLVVGNASLGPKFRMHRSAFRRTEGLASAGIPVPRDQDERE